MRFEALAVVVAVGCYDPRPTAGVACTSACPGDQICVAGFCRDPGGPGDDAAIDSPDIDAPIDGSPDVDTDGDGHFDNEDNCITLANANQHDEDADMLGDACDPCPHIAIGGATDTDTDGVGDACDPAPTSAKQQWLVFDPLTSRATEWNVFDNVTFGADSMTITDGRLRYMRGGANLRVQIGGDLTILTPAIGHQMVIEVSHTDNTHYYYAELYSQDTGGDLKLTRRNENEYPTLDLEGYASLPQGPFAWTLDVSVAAQTIGVSARHGGTQFPALQGAAITGQDIIASPFIHIGASNIALRVDYFALIVTN